MIERIKSWFTEDRAADTDYTAQMIAASFAAARGLDGVRGSAPYQSCVNLISASASIAEVEGQHSRSLAETSRHYRAGSRGSRRVGLVD